MISTDSRFSVGDTADRVAYSAEANGLTVFARIDHAAAARHIGLRMRDLQLLLVGSPQTDTDLLQLDPRLGLEFPQRILVWDDQGVTRVGYEDPRGLADDYAVGDESGRLERLGAILDIVVREAVRHE